MTTKYDPTTGEVLSEAPASSSPSGPAGAGGPARKRKRTPTPEVLAAREAIARHRAAVVTALEAVSPALVAEGDPPLQHHGMTILPAGQAEPHLLDLPRPTASGGPSSTLVVAERALDAPYMLIAVEFTDGHGFRARTRGVAIRLGDARAVARCLLEWANRTGAP